MKIGKAAEASGVSAKMIRYYEGNEIVSRASRQANGYRVYSEVDVHTLRFVKRARDLGFSIAQIRRLVGLWRNAKRSSSDVKKIALAHVSELKQKIVELQSMVSALEHLASHCHGDYRPECPILDDLSGTGNSADTGKQSSGATTDKTRQARPGAPARAVLHRRAV